MGIVCTGLPVQIGLRVLQFKKQDDHAQHGGKSHQQQIGIEKLRHCCHDPDKHPDGNSPPSLGIHIPSPDPGLVQCDQYEEEREQIGGHTTGPICINDVPLQIIMNGQKIDQQGSRYHDKGIRPVLPSALRSGSFKIRAGVDQPKISNPHQRHNISLTDQGQQQFRNHFPVYNGGDGQNVHDKAE